MKNISFKKEDPIAYVNAVRNGFLPKIYYELGISTRILNLSKNECMVSAKKHKTKTEWKTKDPSYYNAALRNGWTEDCCKHMDLKPHWNKKTCIADAKKYKIKKEWRTKSPSAYSIASKNRWLKECYGHMIDLLKPAGYWTFKRCKEDALKYKTKKEWSSSSSSAYSIAHKNGWIEVCCKHMKILKLIQQKESCIKDANKYKTRMEWKTKSRSMYFLAVRNGWLNLCCSNMIRKTKPAGYWTLKRCKEDALKYKTKTEWRNKSQGYDTSIKNGWIDKCCKHMPK